MPKKKVKTSNGFVQYGILAFIVVFGLVGIGSAQVGSTSFADRISYVAGVTLGNALAEQISDISGIDIDLGGSRTQGNMTVDGFLSIGGITTLTGTTTLQDVTLGSNYSEAFDFSAANTSTPGATFSIENTGANKICTVVQINITTQFEGSMIFSLSTSTGASTAVLAPNLIASTTAATGTAPLIDNIESPGTYATDNSDGGKSFRWDNGVFINGQLEGSFTSATSSDYSSAAGTGYINCNTI